MPTVRKRFITPLQKTGKGISRRPTTVAAITVCNQQLSTSAQIISPERCPIQTDSDIAEYYCKCDPGTIYNIIGQRKGVVIGGTSGLWFETLGQVVIVGTATVYEATSCTCPPAGVSCGGTADVTSTAWMLQMECENVGIYQQAGDHTPCGLLPSFTCGIDGYNGFALTGYLDRLEVLQDGSTGNSVLDGSRTLDSSVLYVDGDTYNVNWTPYVLNTGPTISFELSDPTLWRLYGTQSIRIDATIDGELITWYGEQTFDSCPRPLFSGISPTTNEFYAYATNAFYNGIDDITEVTLEIEYPCYDGFYEIGQLCWFVPNVGGCICTDTSLPVTINPNSSESFLFKLPGNWLGQTLYGNFLNIAVNSPLNCFWTWFFIIDLPNPP